jgi:hypothetical protein
MTPGETHDAVADSLCRLSQLTPDSRRAERVRMQCRTRLERRRRPQPPAATANARPGALLTPFVVGAVCVLYAAAFVVTALGLERFF